MLKENEPQRHRGTEKTFSKKLFGQGPRGSISSPGALLPALGGGSGWVIFAHNAHTGEFHNYWSWDHMHNVPLGHPLLVLDMYEHAYHMDYGAAAAKYVDAFLQNVNWEEINRRTEALSKL